MTLRATFALALCLPLVAGGAWADTGQVTAAGVNLRSEPNTNSRVVATLARGQRLEVLEAAGDWLKVRVLDTKAEGYVSRRLVEVTPAAPVSPATPAVAPAAASSGAGPVAIDHRDIGCVVAGQYAKFDACFNPADRVGRGRVLFRAAKADPWFYVEMSREGACHSAVLPKAKPELKSFEYFVDVTDTAFGESLAPERAPDQFFAPSVVAKQEDCDKMRKMAMMVPRLVKPVVVGIARNPAGGVLSAVLAKAAESSLSLTGFASDGVIVSSTGAAPSTSAAGSTVAGGAAAGGGAGGGLPVIAIVGGGLAAAGLVAVVAGGGGGDSSTGSSSGGTGGSGGAPSGVTGQWTGASGSGNGLLFQFSDEGISCTQRYDITANLTQNGGTVSGSMTYSGRSFTCTAPDAELQQILNGALVPGDSGGFPVSGTATDISVTLNIQALTFTGSYGRNTMDLSGRLGQDLGGIPYTLTMKLTRP